MKRRRSGRGALIAILSVVAAAGAIYIALGIRFARSERIGKHLSNMYDRRVTDLYREELGKEFSRPQHADRVVVGRYLGSEQGFLRLQFDGVLDGEGRCLDLYLPENPKDNPRLGESLEPGAGTRPAYLAFDRYFDWDPGDLDSEFRADFYDLFLDRKIETTPLGLLRGRVGGDLPREAEDIFLVVVSFMDDLYWGAKWIDWETTPGGYQARTKGISTYVPYSGQDVRYVNRSRLAIPVAKSIHGAYFMMIVIVWPVPWTFMEFIDLLEEKSGFHLTI